ncbi:MAG: 2-dehydropantoate 2-reductase [Acidobacteriota bacterium]
MSGTSPRMRVGVFGAGGVGGYLGGRLAQSGQEVVFIARGAHVEALRARGLEVRSVKGDFSLPAVAATDDLREAGPVDVVLVAVKSWQLDRAARDMPPLLGPETFVVPFLNGVECTAHLSVQLGEERVLKGTARIISHIAAPGRIDHVGVDPSVAFGEADNRQSARCRQLRGVFQAAGIRADLPDDMDATLWKKFLMVATLGGLGAVTGVPVGMMRSEPETRRLLRQAMEEIARVGRARGVALEDDVAESSMAFVDGLPAEGMASLHRDIVAGRRSELEAWNGAVVRLGREARVPTPLHDFIYGALLPRERLARKAGTALQNGPGA